MAEKEDNTLKRFQQLLQQTINERLLLVKMEIADDLSRIINRMVIGFISGLLILMLLLFSSIVAGEYLSGILESRVAGYAVVAGFYLLLILLILFVFKNPIGRKIDTAVLDALFNKPEDDALERKEHINITSDQIINQEQTVEV